MAICGLYNTWADHSGEMIDWFTERLNEEGWQFLHEIDGKTEKMRYAAFDTGHTLQLGTNAYDPNNSARVLKKYASGLGLTIHYETKMEALIKEGRKGNRRHCFDARRFCEIYCPQRGYCLHWRLQPESANAAGSPAGNTAL